MDKKRVIQEKVEKLLGMFPIVAVVGSMQCGKSTFVNHLRPRWKYYDLESPDDYQLISSDPVAFFRSTTGMSSFYRVIEGSFGIVPVESN